MHRRTNTGLGLGLLQRVRNLERLADQRAQLCGVSSTRHRECTTSSACAGVRVWNTWQNLALSEFLATKPNMQLGGSAEHMDTCALSDRAAAAVTYAVERVRHGNAGLGLVNDLEALQTHHQRRRLALRHEPLRAMGVQLHSCNLPTAIFAMPARTASRLSGSRPSSNVPMYCDER